MTVIPITDFDPEQDDRRDVARLLCLANPEFYEAIGLDEDARLSLLAALVAVPGTDLEPVRVARIDGRVVGMWCGLFPTEQMLGRQLKLLSLLSKRLAPTVWSAFQQRGSSYSKALPPPPKGTVYLSRVAVADSHRGSGLGSRLVGDFIAVANGRAVSLHVRSANLPAVRAYERAGFVRTPGGDDFVLMVHGA